MGHGDDRRAGQPVFKRWRSTVRANTNRGICKAPAPRQAPASYVTEHCIVKRVCVCTCACVCVCVCVRVCVHARMCLQWHPSCCLQVPKGAALPRPREGSATALDQQGQCCCKASFERGGLPWQAVLVAQVVADYGSRSQKVYMVDFLVCVCALGCTCICR